MGKTKIINIVDSKIKIIGDNILYINGTLTAYYVLPLTNYTVTSGEGINYSIQKLTSLVSTLASQRDHVELSIQRFSKIIQVQDVMANLYNTIKLYNKDYDMPPEFTNNLTENIKEFALLGVKIDAKKVSDVEDKNILETAKDMFTGVVNSFLGSSIGIDEERILKLEQNIYNTVRSQCLRATKETVFYNYISKLYPNYDISYDELGYINEENFSDILGSVTQTVEDNFGYFIMHNEGVDFFDCDPVETYGCILEVKKFPVMIHSEGFSMAYPGMQLNIKTLPKEESSIRIKRQRAADKWELEEALKAGAELEQLESTSEAIDIATHALAEIDNGEVICEFNATILLTAEDKNELRRKIQTLQNDLKDRDILAAKSLTQGLDFLNHYVKLQPDKYIHMANLMYPLSFQLNQGALVGNGDSEFFVPKIGKDL